MPHRSSIDSTISRRRSFPFDIEELPPKSKSEEEAYRKKILRFQHVFRRRFGLSWCVFQSMQACNDRCFSDFLSLDEANDLDSTTNSNQNQSLLKGSISSILTYMVSHLETCTDHTEALACAKVAAHILQRHPDCMEKAKNDGIVQALMKALDIPCCHLLHVVLALLQQLAQNDTSLQEQIVAKVIERMRALKKGFGLGTQKAIIAMVSFVSQALKDRSEIFSSEPCKQAFFLFGKYLFFHNKNITRAAINAVHTYACTSPSMAKLRVMVFTGLVLLLRKFAKENANSDLRSQAQSVLDTYYGDDLKFYVFSGEKAT